MYKVAKNLPVNNLKSYMGLIAVMADDVNMHAYKSDGIIYVSQELHDLIQDIDDQAFRRGQLSVCED